MNAKMRYLVMTVTILLAVLVGGCAGATPAAPTQAPTAAQAEQTPIKVALVLSGPISDASWNAAAYNAINGLKDQFDIELQYTENVGLPDIEPTYRGYASKGFDVIVGHGFQFGDPAVQIAKDYPDSKWGIVMGVVEAPNVMSLNFREEETSYLAGYLAGARSKTGVVGGIGGEEVPSIIKAMEAFKLGAKAANPNAEVLITYTGTWSDPTAGYEAAIAQINNKADVLFPVANLTSTGVYKAATEKGVFAVGSEGDQCAAAPGTVLGSITDNIDRVLEIMMTDIANGSFKGGLYFMGIKEGAISFILCKDANPAELETKLADIEKQIVDGTLKVPAIVEPSK